MERKYYTPDISEFCVGFEFETNYILISGLRGSDGSKFVKKEFTKDNFASWIDLYDSDAYPSEFRVKYLDKEDIESLGFVFSSQEYGGTCSIIGTNNKERDNIDFIGIRFEEDWQGILKGPTITLYNNKEMLFTGICKNKSELKRILKMIGYETRQVMDKL